MKDNEFEFLPILLIMVNNYANVGVRFDVDYSFKICRASFRFLINYKVNCSAVKYITDGDHMRIKRNITGRQVADSSFV